MTHPKAIPQMISWAIKGIARTRLPKLSGELKFAGLVQPVEVIRDTWGTPHIYAGSLADLFFSQGFVHAQDRFWQMDFNRRLVAGRLSEILGEIAIPIDRWMRTLTMRRVAEYEQSLYDENTRQLLQAYANGVNAFLARGKLPIETLLLGYRPEPWVIADSLSWVKMMAWTLSVNWEAEILRAHLIDQLGPEKAAELEPPHLSRWPFIIPPGTDYSSISARMLEHVQGLRPFSGPSVYEGLGSNNWVVSGKFTESGKPLLANDMHLGISAPSIWYENHLVVNDISLIGVTFPGIPGVVAGHNSHVAWGFTNGFPDVQDLYIEKTRRLEDGSVEVEYNGKWEKAHQFEEIIHVKGSALVTEKVVVTRHGPIINSLNGDFSGEQPLALRWTALDPDSMFQTILEIFTVKNCDEFHHTLRHWKTPAQNVVYADLEGNIGYTLPGRMPVRAKGRGRIPVPGWTDEYEWISYLPCESLPHLKNPDQGYIVTANNRVVDQSYPAPLELEPISGDRAQRISEMILDADLRTGHDFLTIENFKQIQMDQHSPSARVIARYLVMLPLQSSAHVDETELHEAIKLFKDWDGHLAADSTAAAIYQVFIRKMIWLMLRNKLEADQTSTLPNLETIPTGNVIEASDERELTGLTARFMGVGPTPILADVGLFGERWLPWLTNIMNDADSDWFDLGNGETRDDVMRVALQQTLQELKQKFGPEMSQWSWGKLHQLTFHHPLGTHPILGPLFNLGPFPIGGDQTTVWASGSRYDNLDSANIVGPPYRMIIDLSDLRNSVSILAPGQSGNPASPFYNDQVQAWFKGEYHKMLIDREEIEKNKTYQLKLMPGR